MNRVNQDHSLTVKLVRREWETMSTPDLVNMANQFSHTLVESPQKQTKNTEILNLQLQ